MLILNEKKKKKKQEQDFIKPFLPGPQMRSVPQKAAVMENLMDKRKFPSPTTLAALCTLQHRECSLG